MLYAYTHVQFLHETTDHHKHTRVVLYSKVATRSLRNGVRRTATSATLYVAISRNVIFVNYN